MSKYLVTGGAGFIGSNIVERLLELGNEVRVLDNFSTGKKENLVDFINKIDLVEGDLSDYKTAQESVSGVEFVLHQAALPSVPRSIADPIKSNQANVVGTLNLLNAARKQKIKKFVYASSSSVYGNTPVLPKKEDMRPGPLSPYAVSKLTGEYYCQVFNHVYGLPTVMLRYFNVFGPKQDPKSQYSAAIPKFICLLLEGKVPDIYGDGQQSRDFTYVENVVAANILAALSKNGKGEIINIACGCQITVNRVFEIIRDELSLEIKPNYADSKTGDVMHSLADISKAKSLIGYVPKVSFDQGIVKTINWLKTHLDMF